MNVIKEIVRHSAHTAEVVIESPSVAASARAGHFVMIRFSEDLPRIPFTIVNTDPVAGTFTIIIHKGAKLTELIDSLSQGREVPNLLGPLGQAFEIRNYGTVMCIGDGVGFVPLIPVIRELKKAGNRVITVVSEFSEHNDCLRSMAEKYSDEILSSSSREEAVERLSTVADREKVDLTVMTGPTDMMKMLAAAAADRKIPARCILNMIMLDGIGLCGICRVMVDGKRKLTCIDGPTFDAHLVDFDQLLNRQRNYV